MVSIDEKQKIEKSTIEKEVSIDVARKSLFLCQLSS